MKLKQFNLALLSIAGFSLFASSAHGNSTLNKAFDFWADDSWTEFSYSGGALLNGAPDGIIAPGGGGQSFDTEYLFYKYNADSNDLSIGLQTGFDVVDGHVRYNHRDYYAGDLALSFDGDVTIGDSNESNYGNTYEYAVDFGLFTRDSTGETIESADSGGSNGKDPAGLYRVARWDNDITQSSSSPFAMDWSDDEEYSVTSLTDNSAGSGYVARTSHSGSNKSYWRTVTFNLDNIVALGDEFTVDAHWTMSCGNDAINGRTTLASNDTPVPEPSILALFGIGSLGMTFAGKKKKKSSS
ncbi:MAG: PEP-CTERM sorting domain-containing protein [Bacteroidetes bacterium]|nr:PEP-CTERM sorting domain-containing protein [Bacteroidota bacterium]